VSFANFSKSVRTVKTCEERKAVAQQICLKMPLREAYLFEIIRHMAKYRNNSVSDVTSILKALADRNRLRILMALHGGELCVCQIVELLRLAPSTVSKHLYILKQAGLIDSSKKGRWVYYRINRRSPNKAIRKVLVWLKDSLAGDAAISQDRKMLKKILKEDPEQLCLQIKRK
jgi:ArsR family transcriptional regulator